MKSRTLLLGAAAAIAAILVVLHKSPRFPGDKARVGSLVSVPPEALADQGGSTLNINKSDLLLLTVTAADVDTLRGELVGYKAAGDPPGKGKPLSFKVPLLFSVARSAVHDVII